MCFFLKKWVRFLSPEALPTGSETLSAGSKVLSAGSKALKVGSKALPTSTEALSAALEALSSFRGPQQLLRPSAASETLSFVSAALPAAASFQFQPETFVILWFV